MTQILWLSFILVTLITPLTVAHGVKAAASGSDNYQYVITHPLRPSEDKAKDSKQRAKALLEFFDVEPNMQVLDVFAGDGYYTELMARAMEDTGRVDALNNLAYIDYVGADKIRQRFADKRLSNARHVIRETDDMQLAASQYDRIVIMLGFHDIYFVMPSRGWEKVNTDHFIQQLHQALKPDGRLIIADHSAAKGKGTSDAQQLHRIEAAFVVSTLAESGFKLVDKGNFLQNLDDPLNIPMWDPKVKDRTDRFILKFAKK